MIPSGERRYDVLGYGVAAVDEVIGLDGFPAVDMKIDLRSHETQCGGICVNALAAAARLGLRCAFAGSLGDDALSDVVRRGLIAAGIADESRGGGGPSHAFIIVDKATGTRTILMDKSRVRDLRPDELPEALLRQARALYVDAWHLEAGRAAVEVASEHDVEVIADFEEHDPALVRRLLPFVDHLIVPHGYAKRLTGLDDARDIASALATEWPRRCTAVTCGADGAFYVDGTNGTTDVLHQPAFEAEIVDTTGCGDAFHGAYIAAMLDGLDVGASLRFAAAAAALSARALGAQAGLATRDEVEAMLG